MKRRLVALIAAVALALGAAPAASADADFGWSRTNWVLGTDQSAGGRILVLDQRVSDWSAADALKWSWKPEAANGFVDKQPGWSNPSDARVRTDRRGRQVLLTAASGGLLAVADYPSGRKRWAVNAGGPSNPHAVELLPNGNIAAAASTGGWVRVYTASQGPDSATFTEFKLKTAHGVVWDPLTQLLWAIGHDDVVALRVGGSAAAPTLAEVRRAPLPTADGHDLQPVYGNPNRLWVTTSKGVYQYSKLGNSFDSEYWDAERISRPKVKAVGNNPVTHQVLETTPKQGCRTTWCTDTVDLFRPGVQHTRPGAEFYKARWWTPRYL